MDKSKLRKFAITAREKLEEAVKQKAYTFGITKENIKPLQELRDGLVVNGTVMGEREQKQYKHLKNRIRTEGYQNVMDEAAYTWFNRFIAMRYMEVNDFLPIRMRIFSSETPEKAEPDALTNILSLVDELDLNKERIYTLQEENQFNNLYQYLLIKQSNELGEILPNVFEPITDDLALLLPDNLLNEKSVIRDVVDMVDEEDWEEVEIIGWLYQFYIAEEKESFFANRSKKAGKKDIPSATQLFTPKWIVKYMVDNSLGKYWLDSFPNDSIKESFDYYLDNATQVENVSSDIVRSNVNIEEISFLDPSCGSGHILVYAFDVFYNMYLSRGYIEREIPKLIIENNLYGLDIDKRASQLATFAVVMKAREYDRRLFNRDYSVNIHSIEESNVMSEDQLKLFSENNKEAKEELEKLLETFKDAKLYGSIIQVPNINIELIENQMDYIRNEAEIDIFTTELVDYLFPLIENLMSQYKLFEKKYNVVVTNPPYLGNFNTELKKFVNKHYKDFNKDLFSVFIYRCSLFAKEDGYIGFMTPMVWMFISSYEKLRNYVINEKSISSLVHLEYSAFEEATVPLCTFVLKNNHSDPVGTYIRLSDFRGGMEVQAEKYLEAVNNSKVSYRFYTNSDNFRKIPRKPIAYWVSNQVVSAFENLNTVESISERVTKGIYTGNNNKYLRWWFEVNINQIKNNTWNKYSKGGSFRKWYGNSSHLIFWKDDAAELKSLKSAGMGAAKYYNKNHIVWSGISSGSPSFRFDPNDVYFDDVSPAIILDKNIKEIVLAELNSVVIEYLLQIVAPTLHFQIGDIRILPLYFSINNSTKIKKLTNKNVYKSKLDWDSFETSWDFEEHPFLTHQEGNSLVEDSFNKWEQIAEDRFYQLKENEEELNRIFIDIYGLQDELTPEVEEKDVTVNKADLERDVKSFLSYLVGVMFGRYSLDKKGLAYAGGEWDGSQYKTYQPDESNIVPLTEDQQFDDDIMNKVEDLLIKIYGEDSLEENLLFIAEALKKKNNENSRQRIRRYFMKEFYKDHVKTYQKRPIYWQFSSGRRGAFKGLMYLHRYHENTIAQLRTDYILEETKLLENLMTLENQVIEDESSTQTQKARAQKHIDQFTKDRQEIVEYDQVIDHMAKQHIKLDLDDGVKVNYEKFQNIEVPSDTQTKPKKQNVFQRM